MWTIADGKLWPWPRRVTPLEGVSRLQPGAAVWISDERAAAAALAFVDDLRLHGLALSVSAARSGPLTPAVSLVLDEAPHLRPQGYALVVDHEGARIEARDEDGLRHALSTLRQWILAAIEEHGAPLLPCAAVEDWPAFAERGVMLDVSRTRVPLDSTLLDCATRMAGLKTNRWQLYFEHVYAYAGHEEVWRGASPYTGEEILRLDARLRALGVELVPNQQSFGHMHRWLVHERYRPLAEVPEGVEHAFSIHKEPFALCPSDPAALELVEDLWDQLVPHFRSRTLNIGGDETFDLGLGRSRAEVERRGVGRVYLEHVQRLHERVSARGLTMQLWGDIVVQHPELVAELPRDLVLLEWGYDAGHPFADHVRRFAETGIPFHVCPGTSSWQSVSGRATNALANLKEAALQGAAAGAAGWLVTDWGDRGHLQPRSVSWFGLVAAAGLAWNPECAAQLDDALWAKLVSRFAFDDPSGAGPRARDVRRHEHQRFAAVLRAGLRGQGVAACARQGSVARGVPARQGRAGALAPCDRPLGEPPRRRGTHRRRVALDLRPARDVLRAGCGALRRRRRRAARGLAVRGEAAPRRPAARARGRTPALVARGGAARRARRVLRLARAAALRARACLSGLRRLRAGGG